MLCGAVGTTEVSDAVLASIAGRGLLRLRYTSHFWASIFDAVAPRSTFWFSHSGSASSSPGPADSASFFPAPTHQHNLAVHQHDCEARVQGGVRLADAPTQEQVVGLHSQCPTVATIIW